MWPARGRRRAQTDRGARPQPGRAVRAAQLSAGRVALVLLLAGLATALATGCTETQHFSGIVVAVDGPSLVDVRSATVRATDGRSLTFDVTRLDVANGKPAAHLREHLATGVPIVVDYVIEGGQSVALRYNDAP